MSNEFRNKPKISVFETFSGIECDKQDYKILRNVCAWSQKTSMSLKLGYQNLSIMHRKSTQPRPTTLKVTTHWSKS